MALATIRDILPATPAETFRHIRDFLASQDGIALYAANGAGYAIVDSSYASSADSPAAGDWVVLRSNGEAGTWPLFFKFECGSSTHNCKLYLHWNTETHTGWAELFNNANIQCGSSGCALHIHADLDEVHILIQPGATGSLYWSPFFRLAAGQTLYSGQAVQIAEALPRRDVETVIPLESFPAWAEPGRKIQHWDGATMQLLTITAADATAQTITVASTAAMAAGSFLVEDLCYGLPASATIAAQNNNSLYVMPDRLAGALTQESQYRIFPAIGTRNPDAKYNERLLAPITIGKGNAVRGQFKLAFETSAPTVQGEAWTERNGNKYRLWTVYSSTYLALREAD